MSQSRSLITDGSWVACTQFLAALGQLLGIRLLTEILPPNVFGQVCLWLGGVVLVASGLANPTTQALLKYYPEYALKNNGSMVYNAATRQLQKLLLWCSPVIITLMLTAISFGWTDTVTLFLLLGLVGVEILRMQNMALLNAVRAQRAYGIWSVAEAWGRPVMAWLAVSMFGVSIHFVLLAYFLISLVIWLVMRIFAIDISTSSGLAGSAELSKLMWRYSLPLLPLGLLGWISGMADRYIIGTLLTPADVGLYVAIYGLASRPMLMMGTIVETTFRPVYQQALVNGDRLVAIKYLYKWGGILLVGSCIAMFISMNWHQFLANILLGPQYRGASFLFPWIVAGYAFLAFSDIPLRACYANGATMSILTVLVTDSVLAVVLGYILVYHYGLIGAAIAVPIYYGIRFSLAIYRSFDYLYLRRL